MIIINRQEIKQYDNKTASLFKKPCHDNGSDLPDREVQYYSRAYRSNFRALEARELIKISVLQNCADDPRELADLVAGRTRSQVVQVIGKKIVLYREGKDDKKKIVLP